MNTRWFPKLLTFSLIAGLGFVLWATDVTEQALPVPSASVAAAAGATNRAVHTSSISLNEATTYAGQIGMAQEKCLWGRLQGTNGAAGTVRIFYAVATTNGYFTTDNTDRYIDFTLNGTNWIVNSIPIKTNGRKDLAFAGYAVGAGNGYTNLTMWVSKSE